MWSCRTRWWTTSYYYTSCKHSCSALTHSLHTTWNVWCFQSVHSSRTVCQSNQQHSSRLLYTQQPPVGIISSAIYIINNRARFLLLLLVWWWWWWWSLLFIWFLDQGKERCFKKSIKRLQYGAWIRKWTVLMNRIWLHFSAANCFSFPDDTLLTSHKTWILNCF